MEEVDPLTRLPPSNLVVIPELPPQPLVPSASVLDKPVPQTRTQMNESERHL